MEKKMFSVVLPIYKNELNLGETVPYILQKSPILFPEFEIELIMVNDGSPDHSWEIMEKFQKQYPKQIRIARFIRNFGQGAAIHYGISIARGDVVGVISADLQDPFDLFADMLIEWKNGADLVCGVRRSRAEHGLGGVLSKQTHILINRFINDQYPTGGFDFFLMDRSLARRFVEIQEKNGSTQLLLLWLSQNVHFIPYDRMERLQGKSSWTLSKKVKYFIDTFVSNSYLPLRIMSLGGALFSGVAFLMALGIVVQTLIMQRLVPGWSSLAVLTTFFSGLILLSLGIIGEYLWRIFDEIKQKPMYLVGDMEEDLGKNSDEERRDQA